MFSGSVRGEIRGLKYPEYAHAGERDFDVDFSLGVSPEVPPNVTERLRTGPVSTVNSYKNILNQLKTLRPAIAEYHGDLDPDNVVVTSGCDGAIRNFSVTFLGNGDTAVIPEPTFPRYEFHTKCSGTSVIFIPTNRPFDFDSDAILRGCRQVGPKAVFICNPNNPTGSYIERGEMRHLVDEIGSMNDRNGRYTLVFVDEAIGDYTGESCAGMVHDSPQLVVGRTFSKIFGLAGMRIGYVVAHEKIAKEIAKTVSPFEVPALSAELAAVALDDQDFLERRRANVEGNYQLLSELVTSDGHDDYALSGSPSSMFVLLYGGRAMPDLHRTLLNNGIYTLDGNNFRCINGHNAVRLNLDVPREYIRRLGKVLGGNYRTAE